MNTIAAMKPDDLAAYGGILDRLAAGLGELRRLGVNLDAVAPHLARVALHVDGEVRAVQRLRRRQLLQRNRLAGD